MGAIRLRDWWFKPFDGYFRRLNTSFATFRLPGTVTLNRRVADLVLMRVKTRSTSEKGPMPSFDIDVTRDGGWWAVHIPELGGLTQARYPSEVEPMAREYIAVSTGTSVDQVAINWRRCTLQPR
jgi:hypothetical protein